MIFLKDYIDLTEVSVHLAKQLQLPCQQIESAFIKFFWSDERSDYWYYTKVQCQDVIQEMIKEFLEDVSGVPCKTFVGRVAEETGLDLIGEPTEIYPCTWMEAA